MWGFGRGVPETLPQKSAEQLEKEAQAENDRLLERLATDAEITAAVLDIPHNTDLQEEILRVRKQLESAKDDDERQKLHARYLVLREYQKAIKPPESTSSTSLDSLQSVPDRLAEPWKEKIYPDILTADAMKVLPYEASGEPEPIKKKDLVAHPSPSLSSLGGTARHVRLPAPPESVNGQGDAEQATELTKRS